MNIKELEQALINYAINEGNSEDVASILKVNADDIVSTLQDFYGEWDAAEEPEEADKVIDKYVAILTSEFENEDDAAEAQVAETAQPKFGAVTSTNLTRNEYFWSVEDYANDNGWSNLPNGVHDLMPIEECEKLRNELQAYAEAHGEVTKFAVEVADYVNEVEDVELHKGSCHEGDTLFWSWCGEDYSCTGEFYIDKKGYLHHSFITPLGNEIEIITKYTEND